MTFVAILKKNLSKQANAQIATKQEAYMRNQFHYMGITKPVQGKITRDVAKQCPVQTHSQLVECVDQLWKQPEREYQYAAIDVTKLNKKLWQPSSLKLFEKMIRSKSWWDTVDPLSSDCVGGLIDKFPELVVVMDQWIEDEHLWIRRSAIIFQLMWKQKTDEKRLFDYCSKRMHETDFFIRKAIGWALRQYSKTNRQAVAVFVEKNKLTLSPLSLREASKYL